MDRFFHFREILFTLRTNRFPKLSCRPIRRMIDGLVTSPQIHSVNAFFKEMGIPQNGFFSRTTRKMVRRSSGWGFLRTEFQLRKTSRDAADQCVKGKTILFLLISISAWQGTCRTEGSETSYLFLFVIFNVWTDLDLGCYRKQATG